MKSVSFEGVQFEYEFNGDFSLFIENSDNATTNDFQFDYDKLGYLYSESYSPKLVVFEKQNLIGEKYETSDFVELKLNLSNAQFVKQEIIDHWIIPYYDDYIIQNCIDLVDEQSFWCLCLGCDGSAAGLPCFEVKFFYIKNDKFILKGENIVFNKFGVRNRDYNTKLYWENYYEENALLLINNEDDISQYPYEYDRKGFDKIIYNKLYQWINSESEEKQYIFDFMNKLCNSFQTIN